MMDFSGSAGAATSFDVIPSGYLAFAVLNVKGIKNSAKGGAYLDVELTIDQGQPYAGRKVFEMIGDPQNAGNSEAYRQMGTVAITRILEAGRGAGPNNMAGYQLANYEQLSGLRVAVKLKIEPGTDPHPDKNKVAEWLTPNPASQSGYKGWERLAKGDHGLTAAAPAGQAQGGFGGFGAAARPAAQAGGFGNAGGAATVAGSGFGTPAGNAATSATTGSSTSSGFAATTPAQTTSPSNPGATPGWLAQAGG